MEFTRKRIRGRNQKTYQEWRDESGHYRIVWRNEFMGLDLPDAYYATVLIKCAAGEFWDFVGRRGPYKTFKSAVEGCRKHQRTWQKLIDISAGDRKGRIDRARQLDARSRGSTRDGGYRLMMSIPAWAEGQVPTSLLTAL